MTREEFLKAATAAALASSASSGFLPGLTVAQAALESNFGRSQLSMRANNYFGIKATRDRAFVEMPTREVVNGATVLTTARFARFESMEDCFRFRDALILRSSLYAGARASAQDPETFARALGARWATDPSYAEKLMSVYRACGLAALDCVKEKAPQAAGPENTISS
jgi:flagellum-specific peptidoglycan hydrolase FlgJ